MAFVDWWVPQTPLEAGEVEHLAILANHSVGWRAIGGKLVATDGRLMFRPNRVDRGLGGKVWTAPLAQIVGLGKKPRTYHPFNGGLRTRLSVVTSDAVEHLFVINRLDEHLARLHALR